MRGDDHQQSQVFSYLSLEAWERKEHPLRAIRAIGGRSLGPIVQRFDGMYAKMGRPSVCAGEAYNLVRMRNLMAVVPAV